MTTKRLNNGWSNQWAMARYGQDLLKNLRPENSVIIDSTWYTDEFHLVVEDYINKHNPDKIILISFNDASIVNKNRFTRPVYEVGYYQSPYFIDFWAHVVRDKYHLPDELELLNHRNIVKPFLSYNRKPHEHRLELYNNLVDRGIVNQGIVTMDRHRQLDSDVDNYITSAPEAGSVIVNDILTLGRTDLWCSSFLNIVTETWSDINRAYFVSEKIYKPIVGLRPFFVYADDLGQKWLHDRGFETYENDFKDMYPDVITRDNLVDFLVNLCEASKNISWLQTKFLSLVPKLIHNRDRFYKYVEENNIDNIVNEILTD
jgi:hypothetical protein